MTEPERLVAQAHQHAREAESAGAWDGDFRLSVFADVGREGETYDEVVARLIGAHRSVKYSRRTSVAALTAAGFRVEASPPEPYHYDVNVGTEISAAVVERFIGCFETARRNPAWSR